MSVLEPADERQRLVLSDGGISLEPIPAQLVYFATEEGTLRLAWDVAIYMLGGDHWWSMRVDAHNGSILDQIDWVAHDDWRYASFEDAAAARPLAPSPAVGARASSTYHVWEIPLQAPSFGARSLVAAPHDDTASPLGWHDTGSAQYTITRGNNVYAFEDRNGNDQPGYSPDGGASLVFDFDFDPSLHPVDYEDLAITNLFYWNNIVHDVLYHYGFDEGAGNFQATNFSGEGSGNDAVLAQAQDGFDIGNGDNANFATPPDGSSGRMQMFVWNPATEFVITEPASLAGAYPHGNALFGGDLPFEPEPHLVVPVLDQTWDGVENAGTACELPWNQEELAGNIALIVRGDCNFSDKVYWAQQAGAIGAIIYNCDPARCVGSNSPGEAILNMSAPDQSELSYDLDDITIPSIFVLRSTGVSMMQNATDPGVTAYFRALGVARDSDLDASVIVHEYGHGVSNRLVGGPNNVGCLTTTTGTGLPRYQEQMGEGWSDYIALMLTMTEEDSPEVGRGIGTYLNFEDPTGTGIRTYPYSTSMAVNPTTYGDIANLPIPHETGMAWATMLWEMTWNLIDQHGFSADVYDADGGAGNQIALQLVIEGMKLTPCGPGFVDARDAILEADTLLYGGANSYAIWSAFAKRGLGWSADQGSTVGAGSAADGTEAFDMPPGLTAGESEAEALGTTHRLSGVYPNPLTSTARLALEVAQAQHVTVALYDVTGREVARLHEGALAAGTRHEVVLDGRGLAAGVYLVRVTGEAFTETTRVTILH